MNKILVMILGILFIIVNVTPMIHTMPSINHSSTRLDSNNLLFLGITQGPSIILWGATGYPGEFVGDIEYIANSTGSLILTMIGSKENNIYPPEPWNIIEGWDIEIRYTLQFMSVKWIHEHENHRMNIRLSPNENTDCQLLDGLMDIDYESVKSYNFIVGFDTEDEPIAEEYTNNSNLLFEGMLDGENINGRANLIFIYHPEIDEGVVLVNLLIESLDTNCVIGWSNTDWTPWKGLTNLIKFNLYMN